MTTKVLIVNHGPDPVLVRTVDYGPDMRDLGHAPIVVSDYLMQPTTSKEFYVHRNQQLLVGEKRADPT